MAFQETLGEIAKAHQARREALTAALPPERLDELQRRAEARGARHMKTLLDQGCTDEQAFAAATDEALRHGKHLIATALLHASVDVPKAPIGCAVCKSEQPHVIERDRNGEIVATCVCGHVQKFAADDPDAPTLPKA